MSSRDLSDRYTSVHATDRRALGDEVKTQYRQRIARESLADVGEPTVEPAATSEYLVGKTTQQQAREQIGAEDFDALWLNLASNVIALEAQAAAKPSRGTPSQILGTANSFLLWNLAHGFAAAPVTAAKLVNGRVWLLPVSVTSPGVGVVGPVGAIAVDEAELKVVACTAPATMRRRCRLLSKRGGDELEAAFLRSRTS